MGTEHIEIVKLEPQDIPQLAALLATREELDEQSALRRAELMAWVAFNNPAREQDEPSYYVVKDQGQLIAFHGRMPNYFNIKGERVKGYFVHDLYVDPVYRKKGKGFWLTMALAKAIEEGSDSFFCLYGMTKLNLQMQRRRGYLETAVPIYWRYLNLKPKLKQILKSSALTTLAHPLVKLATDLWISLRTSGLSKKVEIKEVHRFEEDFKHLNDRLKQGSKVSTDKNTQYLNWKFADRPSKRETVLSAWEGDKLLGYIILGFQPRSKEPVGIIVDIWADTRDQALVASLIKAAISFFKGKNARVIQCIVSDERIQTCLQKFWFIQGKGEEGTKTVMLGNLDKSPHKELLSNIENWHFTRSESDAFMLSE